MTTPKTTSLISLLLALALIGTACLGGDDAESTPDDAEPTAAVLAFDDADSASASGDTMADDDTAADTGTATDDTVATGEDRPCDGGAFPDDAEFKQALCNVQWAQTDILRTGGEFDESWIARQSEAMLLYATDRAGALVALAELEAEMLAAAGVVVDDAPATAADVEDLQTRTEGLRDCMVEVGFLIIDAQLSGFDPTAVDAWDQDVEAIEGLVDDGLFAQAETLGCTLRDEIAAAIEDPSLIGG